MAMSQLLSCANEGELLVKIITFLNLSTVMFRKGDLEVTTASDLCSVLSNVSNGRPKAARSYLVDAKVSGRVHICDSVDMINENFLHLSLLFIDECNVVDNFGNQYSVSGYSNTSYSITLGVTSPGSYHRMAYSVVCNLSKPRSNSEKVIPESRRNTGGGNSSSSSSSLTRPNSNPSGNSRGFTTYGVTYSPFLPDMYPDFKVRIAYLIASSGRVRSFD